MRTLLFALCILSIPLMACAQETEQDKIRVLEDQKEMQKTRQVNARMDSAVAYINQGEYELADGQFRHVLANIKSIPSDLVFYFGKNSYHLNKYKQGVDWLTKYIQLKGTMGQYSQEASSWLKKAEDALLAERQIASVKTTQILSKDFTLDCGPSGKVVCPVCNGSTVVIRKDYLGEKYSMCAFCNKLGYLSCDDYNKLLRGQLKGVTESK